MATREQLANFARRLQTSRKRLTQVTLAQLASLVLPPLLLLALVTAATFHFLKPLPPRVFTIVTGSPRSAYSHYAERYRALMARDGVRLVIQPSGGSADSLAALTRAGQAADAAMLQDGLAEPGTPGILSAGAIGYEPIWIFYRDRAVWTRLSDLGGKTVNIGSWGGGGQSFAIELLREAGLSYNVEGFQPPGHNIRITTLSGTEALQAMRDKRLDAAITLGEPNSPTVQAFFHTPGIQAMNLDQAQAIARHRPFFHRLLIPQGGIDLNANLPAHALETVATTSVVYVRADLHPALVTLLERCMAEVHQQPGLLNAKHEFPADKDESIVLHPMAERYYRNGAPLLLRYLPFWLATLLDRTFVVLLPLLALLIPATRMIPQVYGWRMRRRLDRWYAELKFLEGELDREDNIADRNLLLDRIAWIEQQLAQLRLPLAFSNQLYVLKEHIELVRRRILRVTRSP